MLETKRWFQSKSIWFGILTVLTVVAQMFGYDPANVPEWAESLTTGLLALGTVWGRVVAKKRVT